MIWEKLSQPGSKKLLLAILFVFSFVFFLYFTFPYGVLKEALTATISRATGFEVRIGHMGPNFPLGIDASDVKLTKQNGNKTLVIKNVSVELGLVSLFFGRIRIDADVSDGKKGSLSLSIRIPIIGLIRKNPMPRVIVLDAENYPVDGLFDFGLSLVDVGPQYQQFIGPYLEKIAFRGKMNAKANLDIDSDNLANSDGSFNLSLNEGSLAIDDPSLGVDPQIFKKFLIKAEMKDSSLVVDKNSAIESQEITVACSGSVNLKKDFATSQANLNLSYKLEGTVQQGLGFAFDMLSGGSNGQAKLLISGPLTQLRTSGI